MKKLWMIAVLVLVTQGCGKEDPGKIALSLKFDATVTDGIKTSIKNFVFVVGKTGSSKVLLYPSSCLTSAKCFKKDCGFPTSDKTFDPQVDFSNIESGASMTVVSCALDATSAPVSGGAGSVKNSAGASATITMSNDTSSCVSNLPPVCS